MKHITKTIAEKIAELDLSSRKDTLGIEIREQKAVIPFFGEEYIVSGEGISDPFGNRPNYAVCVLLSRYLLQSPAVPVVNKEWAALKDFHKMSQFTNFNVFTSDAERPVIARFSGRMDALRDAAQKLDGMPCDLSTSYDFAVQFKALPQIDLLLLFNDGDDEFPAACSILFQKQAEDYLDPESLIMVGIALTNRISIHD